MTTARPAKAESTLERILDAAEQLFAEKGYEGTSLREIAGKVGIREPSLYSHFQGKEAIYGAVIDRALAPFSEELERWNRKDFSIRDLHAIPALLLEMHASHPWSARILHREFCNPPEIISPKIASWLEQIARQSEVFMSGLNPDTPVNRQKVVANTIALTNITLGYFSTNGVQAALMGEDFDRESFYDEYIKMISKIFRSLVI